MNKKKVLRFPAPKTEWTGLSLPKRRKTLSLTEEVTVFSESESESGDEEDEESWPWSFSVILSSSDSSAAPVVTVLSGSSAIGPRISQIGKNPNPNASISENGRSFFFLWFSLQCVESRVGTRSANLSVAFMRVTSNEVRDIRTWGSGLKRTGFVYTKQ